MNKSSLLVSEGVFVTCTLVVELVDEEDGQTVTVVALTVVMVLVIATVTVDVLVTVSIRK